MGRSPQSCGGQHGRVQRLIVNGRHHAHGPRLIAYYLLQKAIMRKQGPNSVLANALGSDIKGKISPVLYVIGIVLAFVSPWLSVAMYVLVTVMWLIPDRRIERILHEH